MHTYIFIHKSLTACLAVRLPGCLDGVPETFSQNQVQASSCIVLQIFGSDLTAQSPLKEPLTGAEFFV